jgi:adenylate cyclase
MIFTALGDAVNVAARLQDMTKTLECRAVISQEVASTAGIALDTLKRHRVEIRGRVEPMSVFTAEDPTVFASLIDPQSQTAETEPEAA